ncbi:MAG: asparaginase, partial [Rhodobacteraceae bacterium]|nr:asparaginase [Paracoccaceae bacterium]
MNMPIKMVEIWRGDFLESYHTGHAVICGSNGNIIESWGDPDHIILPRSSSKILQALPLVESGAADVFGLNSEHLALSCASHQGALIHTSRVRKGLLALNIDDDSFRCGVQSPSDKRAKTESILRDQKPCQYHNNCSGKHSGFLTLSRHLGAGSEYIDPAHPVQILAKEAFQSMTETSDLGYAIDGCSAPNFATTVHGLSRAMSKMANPKPSTVRGKAAVRLV